MISPNLLPRNYLSLNKRWIPIWHGTKFRFLESIVKNGLRPSGSKLSDGISINPLPGHIASDVTVSGFKIWPKLYLFRQVYFMHLM